MTALRELSDAELEAQRLATHQAMVQIAVRAGARAAEQARRHLDLIHAEQARRRNGGDAA